MTSALCLCVCRGKRLVEWKVGVAEVSAHWWSALTKPPFHRWPVHRAGPAFCTSLSVQLRSLPDPSVWCERCRRRRGALPLMFSLGTGCSLFDFQSKQRKHLQFEQIVQCWPTEPRLRREGPDSAASDPPTGAVTNQHHHVWTQRPIGKIFLHWCLLKNQNNPRIVRWGRRFQATRKRWDFLNRCHWHQTAPELVLIHQLGQNVAKRRTLLTNLLHLSTTGLKYDPGTQL